MSDYNIFVLNEIFIIYIFLKYFLFYSEIVQ